MPGQTETPDSKSCPALSPQDVVMEAERRLSCANTPNEVAHWAEMFSKDLVMGDFLGSDQLTRTRDAVVEWFWGMKASLPDMRIEVKRLTCQGRVVAEEGVIRGTHTGTPLLGHNAAGRVVSWPFCSFKEVSLETGKIVTDYSLLMDAEYVHQQL